MNAGGKDAAGKGEVLRVELEDSEVGEAVLVLIEELVIEDAAWFARFLACRRSIFGRAVGRFAPAWPLMTLRSASWRRFALGR